MTHHLHRLALAAAALLVAQLLLVSPALAEKRVALVIGNGAYTELKKLKNPTNDAQLVAQTLQAKPLEFTLVGGKALTDLNRDQMLKALKEFATAGRDADVVVFYFAGHGIGSGTNYLLPIDASISEDQMDPDLQAWGTEVNQVLKRITRNQRLRLLLLDACRNDPLEDAREREAFGETRGLGAIRPTDPATLITYATAAGKRADDMPSQPNGPFAKALADELRNDPSRPLETILGATADRVRQLTQDRQQPWLERALTAQQNAFLILPEKTQQVVTPAPTPVAPATAPFDEDAEACASLKSETQPGPFRAYLQNFKAGGCRKYAKMRLAVLEPAPVPPKSQTAEEDSGAAGKAQDKLDRVAHEKASEADETSQKARAEEDQAQSRQDTVASVTEETIPHQGGSDSVEKARAASARARAILPQVEEARKAAALAQQKGHSYGDFRTFSLASDLFVSTELSNDCLYEGHATNRWHIVIEGYGIVSCSGTDYRYEGQFQNDKPEGLGFITNPNANRTLAGQFKEGLVNGVAVYTSGSQWRYEGEYQNEKITGYGIMFYNNGIYSIGYWENDKFLGDPH